MSRGRHTAVGSDGGEGREFQSCGAASLAERESNMIGLFRSQQDVGRLPVHAINNCEIPASSHPLERVQRRGF
jgi:hypothetical protein